MAFSSATHQILASWLPWNRLCIMPSRIQLLAASRWGVKGLIKSKAQGGDVAEKSLVGRPCNRLLEKLGKTGCPLFPFPSPSSTHNLRFGLLTAAIKTAFWVIKTSPGTLKCSFWMLTPSKVLRQSVLTVNQNQTRHHFDLGIMVLACLLPQEGLFRCPTLSLWCL